MADAMAWAHDEGRGSADPGQGDVADETADHVITWRATQHDLDLTEHAVLLWSGEVHREDGSGVAGPFWIEQAAALSWALSKATEMRHERIVGTQLVGYLCAKSQMTALLDGGSCAFRRLNRLAIPPVQTWTVLRIDHRGRAVVPA